MKFRWREQEFELVERPTFGEIEHVERLTKRSSEDWNNLQRVRAMYFMSIRRVDHTLITWDQLTEMSPLDFEEIEEASDVEAQPDPTTADA